jgi:hypothetical protein
MRTLGNRSAVAKIEGNVFDENAEQAKADVILNGLGVQVKNYASTHYTVSGNIHPAALKDYYDDD